MPINRDALHTMLWADASGPHHTVVVEQVRLCDDLLVSAPTVNRVLKRMVAEGRLEPVGTGGGSAPRTYAVVEPATWLERILETRN